MSSAKSENLLGEIRRNIIFLAKRKMRLAEITINGLKSPKTKDGSKARNYKGKKLQRQETTKARNYKSKKLQRQEITKARIYKGKKPQK